jgi:hypothetical protein
MKDNRSWAPLFSLRDDCFKFIDAPQPGATSSAIRPSSGTSSSSDLVEKL